MTIVFVISSALLLLYSIYILIRNHFVYKERMRILKLVSALGHDDIYTHHSDPSWRCKSLDKVSYDEMSYKFWKPVKTFYKDHECLGPYKEETVFYKEEVK